MIPGQTPGAAERTGRDANQARRPCALAQHCACRPRWGREDDTCRAAAVSDRRDLAAWPRGRRNGEHGLRARGAEAARVAEPCGGGPGARRNAGHTHRHPRLPGLFGRGGPGVRRGGRGAVRDGCVGGRGVGPGDGGRPGSNHRSGRVLLHQQVRPGERGSHRGPGRAARGVRQQDRAAPSGDRRGRNVHRVRRSGPPQGVALGGQPGGRDPDPGGACRRSGHAPRPVAGGCGRGRRRRPDQVPRGRGESPMRNSTRACIAACGIRSLRRCS